LAAQLELRAMSRATIRAIVAGAVGAVALVSNASAQSGKVTEHFCTKAPLASWKDAAIACYSDRSCAFVKARGGDPIPDYDAKSVSAALGRGKIEGILTPSSAIAAAGRKFGYACHRIVVE
jgi:hypothetical protein